MRILTSVTKRASTTVSKHLTIFYLFLGLFMTQTLQATMHNNSSNSNHTTDTADTTMITKSNNDKREYKYAELPNGLKLLVVSDKDAQRSAAAVDVNVGSASDPKEYLGLAHFLEHMLFLGTDKFPNADDYINYISDHGGNHNAFTAFDHTNYFFDIDPHHLKAGLERFSRFFVAPLMLEKYVERERNAVDSEYQSKLREDGWRSMDALKQAVSKEHPYSQFNVGNLETLSNDGVREALLEFYKSYYSAERMSAVIIGREDTDTLMQWGRELFADVPNNQTKSTAVNTNLFDGVKLPIAIKSKSIKNEKNLSLYFQFPYQLDAEYSKSLGYLSYILGYEGKGSLLETLKSLDYVSQLYSGAGYKIGKETSFEIGMQLTEKGYRNTDSVLAVVFAYLDLIKQDTTGLERYKEIATVAQTAFRFKEKRQAIHEVSGLSTRLNRYPVQDVQSLSAIFTGYNKKQIDEYLAQMTTNNAVVQISSPDIESDTRTKYFEVPYRIEHLDSNVITHINPQDKNIVNTMHLPLANPFIADSYNLRTDAIAEESEILANGIELFYKNDTSFSVPRASVQLSLQPTKVLSMVDKTTMSLFALWLDEILTTTLYDASIAGVHSEVASGEKSIAISLEGYQQKMPNILQVILQYLKLGSVKDIDMATFERVKENYRQDLQNVVAKMPYQQTFTHLNYLVTADASLPSERLAVLDSIDAESLVDFVHHTLSSLAVRMLAYGNETYDEAQQLANIVADTLSQSIAGVNLHNKWNANVPKVLTESKQKVFTVPHEDNAITYYIQAGNGYKARAEVGLLAKILEPLFFTKLRTEQQLGYIVFAYPRPSFLQAGLGFTVQSPVANVDALENHITNFISEFVQSLDDNTILTDGEFDEIKTILKAELLQKQDNLVSAAGVYWSDILVTGKAESTRQAIAKEIDTINREQFVDTIKTLFKNGKRAIIKAVPEK